MGPFEQKRALLVGKRGGQPIARPFYFATEPPFAAFSLDGSYLMHIDSGFVLRKWFLDPVQLLDFARTRVTRALTSACATSAPEAAPAGNGSRWRPRLFMSYALRSRIRI